MADVTTFDKRLRVESMAHDGLVFRDADDAPFAVYGVFREDDRYRRVPRAVAEETSEAVAFLNDNTAGGRVRFRTDSNMVAVHATLCAVGKMPHFALTGSVGFDVYADGRYAGTLIPPFDVTDEFEAKVWLDGQPHDVQINFPLYSGVKELFIGLADGASLESAASYDGDPVVFYGSSITQGGCASRAGNSYQAILSRELDFDYINLGFSGSALAEEPMVKHIASLPMSAFVMDYDHNAPTAEHLRKTHEPFYQAVRAAHPDLPIVMMTRPVYRLNEEELERLSIVRATYDNARAAGDEHVYFIDGRELVGEEFVELSTVDGCHPNDIGFYAMAKRLKETLEPLFRHN